MATFIKQVEYIKRIDALVSLRATGSSEALAYKLGISKTKLYRMINIMKDLDAPIVYDIALQSFIYEKEVGFTIGFYLSKDAKPSLMS